MSRSKTKPQEKPVRAQETPKQVNVLLFLIVICAASILFRFLFALMTTKHPISNIDEFLYYGMARSIATKGELLFRGREADYQYIFYPLILSPVYRFFREGSNYYRLLQFWNCTLISLSAFPLYGISAKLLKDQKKALVTTAILMLSGDFILGQVIYSENVIYPLFFTSVFCTILAYEKKSWGPGIALGVIAALLYETKPGAFVLPVVSLFSVFLIAVKEKDLSRLCQSLIGIAFGAATCIVFVMVRKNVFHVNEVSGLSLYNSQLGGTSGDLHIGIFFKSQPQYLYYFILACGMVCFIIPVTKFSGYDTMVKRVYIVTLVSLLSMILGTAWTINRYEYATHAIHLRYIGMFVPAFIMISLAQSKSVSNPKAVKAKRIFLCCILAFVILCAAVWGVGGSENASAMIHELLSLPYSYSSVITGSGQRIAGIIVIIAALFIGYAAFSKEGDKKLNKTLYAIPVFLLAGNITAYCIFYNAYASMESFSKETDAALQAIDGRDYLYVLTSDRYIAYADMDSRTAKTTFYVKLNDLFSGLYAADGKYVPFVSEGALRGTKAGKTTPDVDTIVVDNSVFSMVKLSEYTTDLDPENTLLHVLRIEKDKRVFDTIIANVESNKLKAGDPGILVLFNKDLLSDSLTVRLSINAGSETSLRFFSAAETKTEKLTPGTKWYEFTFDSPQQAYNIIAESDILILEYEIKAN